MGQFSVPLRYRTSGKILQCFLARVRARGSKVCGEASRSTWYIADKELASCWRVREHTCRFAHSLPAKHLSRVVGEMSVALETVCGKLALTLTDDPATRLVALKIIELAQCGVRDAPTLNAMTLKEFKTNLAT